VSCLSSHPALRLSRHPVRRLELRAAPTPGRRAAPRVTLCPSPPGLCRVLRLSPHPLPRLSPCGRRARIARWSLVCAACCGRARMPRAILSAAHPARSPAACRALHCGRPLTRIWGCSGC